MYYNSMEIHLLQKNPLLFDRSCSPKAKINNIIFYQQAKFKVQENIKNVHRRGNQSFSNPSIKNYQCENNVRYPLQKRNTCEIKKKYQLSQVFMVQSANFYTKQIPSNQQKVRNTIAGQQKSLNRQMPTEKRSMSRKTLQTPKVEPFLDKSNIIFTSRQPKLKRIKHSELSLMNNNQSNLENQQFNITKKQIDRRMSNNHKFNLKINDYYQELSQVCQLHQIGFKKCDLLSPKFYLCKGNNSRLIRDLIRKRWWWTIIEDNEKNKYSEKINFLWSQIKDKQYFLTPKTLESGKQKVFLHNHFQYNDIIGNKKSLFHTMKGYYEGNGEKVFENLPLTFHVEGSQCKEFQQFAEFAQRQQRQRNKAKLWILKPGENTNRGKGITIHGSIQQLKKQIEKQESEGSKQSQRSFIIQSYIQKPFLYNKRKFDIRCYMMICSLNNSIKGYWYQKGYIRTSCFEFKTDDVKNAFIHLTNDAVQKHSQGYGKYEDGNKLDFPTFKKYLENKYPNKFDFDKQIYSKIKKIATDSIKASWKLLSPKKSQSTVFEIFGLDFMIDSNFKPWLLEINSNPCLQTSCYVLQKIIPKMVDDAFKISIDAVFPPPQEWPESKKSMGWNIRNQFQLVFDEQKYKIGKC